MRSAREVPLVSLPQLCTACSFHQAYQLIPERGDASPPYRYDVMCPLCLDSFLAIFPITPQMFARRETTARLHRVRFHRALRRASAHGLEVARDA